MSNEVTLKDLYDSALDLADMAGSSYPNKTRVLGLLNEGLSEIHEILCGQEYRWKTYSFTGSAGTEEYDLPGDFYKVTKLWRLSGNRRFPVRRFNISELEGHRTTGPSSAESYELWYAPAFVPLERDSQRVDSSIHPGWEWFAIYHAAAQLRSKEEAATAQMYMADRVRVRARIIRHFSPRDAGGAVSIEDFYGRWNSGVYDDDQRSVRYRVMDRKMLLTEFDYVGV